MPTAKNSYLYRMSLYSVYQPVYMQKHQPINRIGNELSSAARPGAALHLRFLDKMWPRLVGD